MITALFVVLVALDIWTTVRVVRAGGAEGNALVAWFAERLGLVPALVGLSVPLVIIVWALAEYGGQSGMVAAVLVTGYRAAVVHHNWKVLRGMRDE